MKQLVTLSILTLLILPVLAQRRQVILDEVLRTNTGTQQINTNNRNTQNTKKDSLGFEHRDDRKDSTTVTFKPVFNSGS